MNSANDNTLAPNIDKTYFCQKCGSCLVDVSSLAGGEASCKVCGWKGVVGDLAVLPIQHDFFSQEEMIRSLFLEIRKLLASPEVLQSFGRLLLKWGFIQGKPLSAGAGFEVDPKLYARYIGSIAKAIAEALINTRVDIEKETARDRS